MSDVILSAVEVSKKLLRSVRVGILRSPSDIPLLSSGRLGGWDEVSTELLSERLAEAVSISEVSIVDELLALEALVGSKELEVWDSAPGELLSDVLADAESISEDSNANELLAPPVVRSGARKVVDDDTVASGEAFAVSEDEELVWLTRSRLSSLTRLCQ